MNPRILSVATSHPDLMINQDMVYEIFCDQYQTNMNTRTQKLVKRLSNVDLGIQSRFIASDNYISLGTETVDEQVARFQHYGTALGAVAVEKCLKKAGFQAEDIDCLIVNTCTGYLCPGLSSYLIEECGFRKNLQYYDIMGMGCAGAMPSLELANSHLRAFPEHLVLVVAIEICSATFCMDDDISLILSDAIFGDGCGALLLANGTHDAATEILDFETRVYPEYRDRLRYRTKNSRLHNVLDSSVPDVGASSSKEVIVNLLNRNGIGLADISHWIIHPGGKVVLDKVRDIVGLPEASLAPSRRILRLYGNMSSASVIFVLEEVINTSRPAKSSLGVMNSFGAGFKNHAALLRF
jgi:predicted naringenin-chalcone synthase